MKPFDPINQIGPGISPAGGFISQFLSAVHSNAAPTLSMIKGYHFDLVVPWLMSLNEWADAFVYTMAHTVPLPQFDGDFQRWASQIAQESVLVPFQLPQPVDTEHWVDWATQVNHVLETSA